MKKHCVLDLPIQNYKKLIIFDFRKREDFNINHIHNSINIPFNEFDFKFFETIDDQKLCYLCNNFVKCDELKCMLKRYKRYYIVLIMSQEKIKRKTIEAIGTDKKLNSEEEKDQIIKKISEISQMRVNLYANLQDTKRSSTFSVYINLYIYKLYR